MHLRSRMRWLARFAWIALLCQQAAMAAYVCPLPLIQQAFPEALALNDMPCHQESFTSDAAQHDPRCDQHCEPIPQTDWQTHALDVPPLLHFTHFECMNAAAIHNNRPEPISPHGGAPPLNIRYCSFQC